MCGIFGIYLKDKKRIKSAALESDLSLMLDLAKNRGQDSSGIAIKANNTVTLLRKEFSPSALIKDKKFAEMCAAALEGEGSVVSIGQCRLVTNGSSSVSDNNQPIHTGNVIGVHNGIITNIDDLEEGQARTHVGVSKESTSIESDSKMLYRLINREYDKQPSKIKAFSDVLVRAEGAASLASIFTDSDDLVLFTNFGSLYYVQDRDLSFFAFASEKAFLDKFLKGSEIVKTAGLSNLEVHPVRLRTIMNVGLSSGTVGLFELGGIIPSAPAKDALRPMAMVSSYEPDPRKLKRCQKCILPETYPFIRFDDKGVCNYCLNYKKQVPEGEEKLEAVLSKYRSKDGSHDCLVGLSGGRDSCYGLHLIKEKYKMNPLVYTYDWGLTTDVARVNIAKMVGKLGVEHVIRAPNLAQKRRYLRKNIDAWLHRPHLGMVPLFMAGDKDFYHYGRHLRKETGIKLTIFCAGQQVEQRPFFVGFCGVDQSLQNNTKLYDFSKYSKLKLALWYGSQYLKNYKYLNESLADSARSFLTSFLQKDDFLYLFRYVAWDEKLIEKTLQEKYDWSRDTKYGKNQWRMGDGQTSFTNYIYYRIAGFSEFDEFRSNQIREGMIDRKDALELAELDNIPKYETLDYFGHTVGVNIHEVLNRINQIPRLYS